MTAVELGIDGLLVIELAVHADDRGFFVERFQTDRFAALGLPGRFVQDNHSRSRPRVLRGLHYQCGPAQGKLVGVTRGRVWDVAVDLRPGSPTFGRHAGVELSGENGRLLWVPPGFAHGFCVLGDEPADVLYKVDGAYNPAGEGGVHWADRDLAIRWPVADPVVSPRDHRLESFARYRERPAAWDRGPAAAPPARRPAALAGLASDQETP
jgi:dTDP-4-dehydrorhamnose 3,5-epimerase